MTALPAVDTCPVLIGLADMPDRCGAELTITGSNTEGWVALCTFGHQTIVGDLEMTRAWSSGYDE